MTREEELNSWENIIFSFPVRKSELEVAYKKGMLKKNELEDRQYYLGYCRNGNVAQWIENENAFFYMRRKWDDVFPEKICHPEDDNKRDIFVPFKKVEPKEAEKIKEGKFASFILHRK